MRGAPVPRRRLRDGDAKAPPPGSVRLSTSVALCNLEGEKEGGLAGLPFLASEGRSDLVMFSPASDSLVLWERGYWCVSAVRRVDVQAAGALAGSRVSHA